MEIARTKQSLFFFKGLFGSSIIKIKRALVVTVLL